MNKISIIINGVRYDDASPKQANNACSECDLFKFCRKTELHNYTCYMMIGEYRMFKKSDKKFER